MCSDLPTGGGGRASLPFLSAALLAVAAGCFLDFSDGWEGEEHCGVSVKWNAQGDRDGLCAEVEACEAALGRKIKGLPAVEFVDDPLPYCLSDRVAGCYTLDFDHIFLEYRERIADTALCHELVHRAIYHETGSDPDYRHVRAIWDRLP
jgi:hypothetical protein